MTKTEIAEIITEALYTAVDEEVIDNMVNINTFEDESLLTSDNGLVIRIDEDCFYLTIQKR